ncbi:MAG: hypothetical protein GTO62_12000 [Planctomycetales bacterium]|nr:hypothetical protein [Planctomycetales bacterium]NIP85984.1 hypothetical protein [Planctomycetales bacterium]
MRLDLGILRQAEPDSPQGPDLQKVAAGQASTGVRGSAADEVQHQRGFRGGALGASSNAEFCIVDRGKNGVNDVADRWRIMRGGGVRGAASPAAENGFDLDGCWGVV